MHFNLISLILKGEVVALNCRRRSNFIIASSFSYTALRKDEDQLEEEESVDEAILSEVEGEHHY